ncbi:MAG: GNAT family N-acetyltransferase [Kofleriaceae bacterium]
MIDVREDSDIELAALAKPIEVLARLLAGSRWFVHAHDGPRLVGFARAITDGVATAYLSSVMVDPDYRRRGIGRTMIERLLASRDDVRFVLHTRPEAAAFYAALGFTDATAMMVRDRR